MGDSFLVLFVCFFNESATTEIYTYLHTLSLHDALPIAGVDWGWAVITQVNGITEVKADVKRDFGSTSADTRWRLGMWSDQTGWPKCGVFFEQRLFAGGSPDKPPTFAASPTSASEKIPPGSGEHRKTPGRERLWQESEN